MYAGELVNVYRCNENNNKTGMTMATSAILNITKLACSIYTCWLSNGVVKLVREQTFLLLSLGRYIGWWTISHLPSSHVFRH